MGKKIGITVISLCCAIGIGFVSIRHFFPAVRLPFLPSSPSTERTVSCPDCNVVLVSLDTCGAKYIQCYGYSHDTMPNLCTFGKEHLFFANAYSNGPWTLPSHVSLFTGLSSRHKVNNAYTDRLSDSIPLLPQILQKAGYTTSFYAPADAVNFPKDLVYTRGIDRWDTEQVDDSGNIGRAMQELRENDAAGKKSFIFFHTYVCHGYMDDGSSYVQADGSYAVDKTNPDQVRYVQTLYEARMKKVDATLIPALDKAILGSKLKKKTILIMTADHGEEFMQHGELNHTTLYDFNMKVPLVMYVPDMKPRTITDNVQTVDLFSTILDLVGVPNMYTTDGISLVPLMNGTSIRNRLFLVESGQKTLRKDDWKLFVVRDDRNGNALLPYKLYNTKDDPDETQDVLAQHFDIANSMLGEAIAGNMFSY